MSASNEVNTLNILIVDDEAELRQSVTAVIKENFLQPVMIKEAEDAETALRLVDQEDFDFIFMDVRMPGISGLEALTKIKSMDPRIMVIILTAHSNLQDAVSAIKDGAYDYLTKPIDTDSILKILNDGITAKRMVSDLTVSAPIFDDDIESEIIGSSKKMKEVFDLVYRLSKVDTTVLIRGEHGTGKELVARAIHHNSSKKSGKFLTFNCASYNDEQLEIELFGHEKGAFEGALKRKIGVLQEANNGTLFLDEIGSLKPNMQAKFLRVLQEKTFIPLGSNREVKTNARIIASTSKNLEKMIEEGNYREDLFYRLNVMPIFLPPLRERLDDLETLALFFIKKFNKNHDRRITALSKSALALLKMYNWSGNIRELENVIEHAFIVEKTDQITTESLPENIRNIPQRPDHISNTQSGANINGPLDFDRFKEESEKQFIVQALKNNNGRINKTVAAANIPKNTLLRKIKKYGINVKDYQ